MFIGIRSRSQVSVYRTIGLLVTFLQKACILFLGRVENGGNLAATPGNEISRHSNEIDESYKLCQVRDKHTVGDIVFYKHTFLVKSVILKTTFSERWCKDTVKVLFLFLARLHEVHRAIAVTPVVHIPVPVRVRVRVPVRVTLALKFSRSPYLDNHSSESIHTWTIDTL